MVATKNKKKQELTLGKLVEIINSECVASVECNGEFLILHLSNTNEVEVSADDGGKKLSFCFTEKKVTHL